MAQHPAHAQNHRHPDEPRPEEVLGALAGLGYPARKQKILETARHNGANGEIMAALEKFTDRHFDSAAAIERELTRTE